MAETAEGGDHLVRREEDAVAVADLSHPAPVALGRREAAAGILHGLHVHEAHRLGPHREDRLLELVEQELGELGLGLLGRPVVAVRVRDVAHLRISGSNGARIAGMPLIESAPIVVPWYAT